jgi:Glycosyl transferase family 8 C-terminal
MAQVSGNMLTTGLRGKIGKLLVFRLIRGKTFASHAPCKPDKSKETVAQRQTRTRFKDASQWAKKVLLDANTLAYYKQRAKALELPNAYTAAIKDYLRCPQVDVNLLFSFQKSF